jgi:hypothetical protein
MKKRIRIRFVPVDPSCFVTAFFEFLPDDYVRFLGGYIQFYQIPELMFSFPSRQKIEPLRGVAIGKDEPIISFSN